MNYFDQALRYMEANPNLAGWAQAAGAVVALVLAIGVPAYQRYAQSLDARRERAQTNLALAASVSLVVGDVINFLNGLLTLVTLPRSFCRSEHEVSDLLERIRQIESREFSHARIVTLYTARGALILANKALWNPDMQSKPLSEQEVVHLKADVTRVEQRYAIAKYDADFSIARCRSVNIFWPCRPVVSLILRYWAFFKHPNVPLIDRINGTK